MTQRKVGAETKLSKDPDRDNDGCRRDYLRSIEKKLEEHLSMFSRSSHNSDQSAITLRADWTERVAAAAELDEDQTAKLSAKREKRILGTEERRVERESIKKRKRKGPRTEPWGTPLRRRKGDDRKELRHTRARRSERKERRKRTTHGGKEELRK